jgi:hypothetical protein
MTIEELMTYERNARLKRSDELMHLTDHPRRAEILAYRQALRDYPAHTDWPDDAKMPCGDQLGFFDI